MNKKALNRLHPFGIFLLVIAAGVLFVAMLRTWHRTTMDEQLNQREQLQLITSDLEPGMTKTDVLEVLNKQKWTSYEEIENEIRLWTKPQPLPTAWGVRLLFKNDKLTAVKYYNTDNISKRPEGAPLDVIE